MFGRSASLRRGCWAIASEVYNPRNKAAQAEGKFVVMRNPAGTLARIAPTSPLARAAGIGFVGAGDLTPTALATGRSPTLTLPPAPAAPSALVTLAISLSAAEHLLGASLQGMAVGTTGGTVQGNLRFVERAAPTRNVVAILPGADRSLRGQYVAIGAHSDHIGYRATGPVDHDSLHLFAARRYLATENPTAAPLSAEESAALAALEGTERRA